MTNSIPDRLSLPAQGEIEAAVRGQRELAAYLSTKMETQKFRFRMQITTLTRLSSQRLH